ncbi:MAG: hypothetical protein P8188_19390 [Gemmatimonadota bacterium]
MGTSIQIVGSRVEFFNDLDLLLVIQLMLEALGDVPPQSEPLYGLARGWREQLSTSGPGTIDLGLERLRGDAAAQNGFSRLLDRVRDELSRFGNQIPADVLNSRYRVSGVQFFDYSVDRLLDVLEKKRRLVGIDVKPNS